VRATAWAIETPHASEDGKHGTHGCDFPARYRDSCTSLTEDTRRRTRGRHESGGYNLLLLLAGIRHWQSQGRSARPCCALSVDSQGVALGWYVAAPLGRMKKSATRKASVYTKSVNTNANGRCRPPGPAVMEFLRGASRLAEDMRPVGGGDLHRKNNGASSDGLRGEPSPTVRLHLC
jgi:hypothetical protein